MERKRGGVPNAGKPFDEQIGLVKQSELFDASWYLERYPDVASHKLDPVEHYFYFGASEGRNPGPNFNTAWYVKTYPDVSEAGMNPLVHYLTFGEKEGRKIQPNQK